MPCWLIFCLFVANFLVHDCSKQFDLKEYLTREESKETKERSNSNIKDGLIKSGSGTYFANIVGRENEEISEETRLIDKKSSDTELQESIPIGKIVGVLLTNTDTLLIFSATVFFMYGIFAVSALQPLLVTEVLEWGIQRLSAIYLCTGILELIILFVLGEFFTSFCIVSGSYYFSFLEL